MTRPATPSHTFKQDTGQLSIMSEEATKTELEYLAEIANNTRGISRRLSYLIFCAVILVLALVNMDSAGGFILGAVWVIASIIWGIVGLARASK